MRTFARVVWLLLLERVLVLRLWALRIADRIVTGLPPGLRPGLPEDGWGRELVATLTAVVAGGVTGALVLWAALALPWWA